MTARPRFPLSKAVREATKRFAPDWFEYVTIHDDTWIVVDAKGRFWHAERIAYRVRHWQTNDQVYEIFCPVFGPCETIRDAVDMTVTRCYK